MIFCSLKTRQKPFLSASHTCYDMAVVCTKQIGYIKLEGQAVFYETLVNRQVGIKHRFENIVVLFISFGNIGHHY